MAQEFSDESMAEVGRALMKAVETYADKGWHPMDCPSEIVGDLHNERDEARAEFAAIHQIAERAGYEKGLRRAKSLTPTWDYEDKGANVLNDIRAQIDAELPRDPDVSDGHDCEGFVGGCERFGCPGGDQCSELHQQEEAKLRAELAAMTVERDKLKEELEAIYAAEPVAWTDPACLPLADEADVVYLTSSNFDGNTVPLFIRAERKI